MGEVSFLGQLEGEACSRDGGIVGYNLLITKLRVDGGRVIDVSEALALMAVLGQKELESVIGVTSCFVST